MLTPLNRAQLAAVFQQDRCQEIVRILDSTTSPSQARAPWIGLPPRCSPWHPGAQRRPFPGPRPELAVRHLRGQEGLETAGPSPGWMESGRRQRKI